MVESIERNKEYFWQSTKDGSFHSVKLNSINKHGDYIIYIGERVHDGWLTTNFTQQTGIVVTIKKDSNLNEKIYEDLGIMLIDYMYKIVLNKSYFEFEKTLYFYKEFLDLLHYYPDRYIKYIDRILSNPTMKKLIDKEYRLPKD